MAVQWCSNYQFNAPDLATGVTVTPNASAFSNSGWVTLFTADADSVLTGLTVYPGAAAAVFEVDVGVSIGGGGETVIATHSGQNANASVFGWGNLPFRIPIDAIPNGAVVRVRMRKSGTSVLTWRWACTYFKKPIVGTILTTTQPQLTTAANPRPQLDPNTTEWANGAWTTIFTTAADTVIVGYSCGFDNNAIRYIIDLGVSSTPIYTFRDQQGAADFPIFQMFKHPRLVASGAAVQARQRKAGTSATVNFPLVLHYYELPL